MLDLKTFKNKTVEDCGSWENWLVFLKENEQYAKTKSTCDDFQGKCHPTELPSYHPFWDFQVDVRLFKFINERITKYNLCKEDPELIKVYFGATATLLQLKLEISNYILKLKYHIIPDWVG